MHRANIQNDNATRDAQDNSDARTSREPSPSQIRTQEFSSASVGTSRQFHPLARRFRRSSVPSSVGSRSSRRFADLELTPGVLSTRSIRELREIRALNTSDIIIRGAAPPHREIPPGMNPVTLLPDHIHDDFILNPELVEEVARLSSTGSRRAEGPANWSATTYMDPHDRKVYIDPYDRLRKRKKTPSKLSIGSKKAKFQEVANASDAKYYDFLIDRTPGPKTSVFESIATLIKACLGGGFLSMHVAYMNVGLWTGLVLNTVLGLMVTLVVVSLVRTAHKAYGRTQTPLMSYSDLAEACFDISPFKCLRRFSKCMRYMVDVTITFYLFTSCCAYQVILAKQIRALATHFYPGNYFSTHLRLIIAMLIVPFLLLSWILALKHLAPAIILADVVVVLVAGTTVYYSMQDAPTEMSDMSIFKDFSGLFMFVGVCVFSLQGISLVLPIENQMKNPQKMTLVVWVGMSIVVVLVTLFGFFGYYGFGEKCVSPITLNYPFNSWNISIKFSIIFMTYVTYALNFWVPFNVLWVYIKPRHKPNHINCWEIFYRTIFIVLISGIAVAIPDIEHLIGVIGAFFVSLVGFIYPAIFELLIDWKDPGPGTCLWRLWKCLFYVLFGVFVLVVGTVNNAILLYEALFTRDHEH